jgi:hypothetical protein
VHKEEGQRSKIQGARGLDLKDLLLLPSSPPLLLRLLVLITLGLEKKKEQWLFLNTFTDSPFLLLLFLSLLIPSLYFSSLSLCSLIPPFYLSSLSLGFHLGIIPWLYYGNMSLFF